MSSRQSPHQPGVYQPPEGAVSRYGTTEDDRGGRFFEKHRMWRIFHDDRGRTTFTKSMLEEIFYEDHADRQVKFDRELAAAATPAEQQKVRKERKKERESRRRHMERLVQILQKIDVPIHDVDSRDRPINEEELAEIQSETPSAERLWRYNPDGDWARNLDELLDTYGIHGYELVGIMACRSLLQDLEGLPQLEAVRGLVDKMTGLLPPGIREDAIEQSRAWRYALGDVRKYATRDKKEALARWYEATILRRQVEIEHRSPGKPARVRRIAALGTTFDREENAVYLLGCEEDPDEPGAWKWPVQWKFDRVFDVRPIGLKNPPLSAIRPHERVRPAAGPGPERLDIAHLFSDSAGSFFRYGAPTIRLEVLVHAPNWIAWCVERPFHPKQRVFDETDDRGRPRLRLVVDRCDEEEISSRLLRLGGNFTVVSPSSLISKLRDTAAAIVNRHA
jgi:predicted DNA-binding transcriptional regulator YafY